MWPARRVLSYHGGRALRRILSEDGCALAGLLVGGERVGDAARRGERVHITVAALNAPERSIECVRRVHLFDGGHVHAGVNAPLCALRVRRERRRHGLVVERNVGCFVACQVAIDTVAVHALAVCVAELGRVCEGDSPRADLLTGHAHVLAAAVVADGIKVVNDIHAAVAHEVSVQGLVDEAGDATVDDDGVAVRVVVGFADGLLDCAYYEREEIDSARIKSAVVRSRVKDVLFGDGDGASRTGEGGADGTLPDGLNLLVAGSCGSGKSVALVDDVPTRNQFARPDMVLSLNGRTVEVYNHDGVPLSTIVDGRGVFLVNEATGERVSVPESASHVFFVRDNFVILPPAGW